MYASYTVSENPEATCETVANLQVTSCNAGPFSNLNVVFPNRRKPEFSEKGPIIALKNFPA